MGFWGVRALVYWTNRSTHHPTTSIPRWTPRFQVRAEYNFHFQSQDRRRDLPGKIVIGRNTTETAAHVVLKLLGFLLFYRDRVAIAWFAPGLLGGVHADRTVEVGSFPDV